jgi:LysM repeat protein
MTMFSAPPPPHLVDVVVHSGDTMTAIADRDHTNWQAVEEFSKVPDPNLIFPGEVLKVPEGDSHNPGYTWHNPQHSAGLDEWTDPGTHSAGYTPKHAAPVTVSADSPTSVSTAGMAAFEACVISRESGGDATAQNPDSTASGLFQFLDTTWNGYGGYARAMDAPVAVQEAYFNLIMSEPGGAENWTPYDGCVDG